MRLLRIALTCLVLPISRVAFGEPMEQLLPTGQMLTPTATPGAQFSPLVTHVGPYPSYIADGAAAIAVSPDKSEMLVLTSGYNRYNGSDGKVAKQQSTQYIFRFAIGSRGARRLQTLQVPNAPARAMQRAK